MKRLIITAAIAITAIFLNPEAFGLSLKVINVHRSTYRYPASIEDFALSVTPQGSYIEYGLYLDISSNGSALYGGADSLEIEFMFELNQNAILNDSWLWVDNYIVKAELIDRWSASLIYEGIVNRRKDPSIMFKNSATKYELRIYPLLGEAVRRIKINWLEPLSISPLSTTANLPLKFLSYSANKPKNVKVYFLDNDEFHSIAFMNKDMPEFTRTNHEYFGDCMVADLSDMNVKTDLQLELKSPLTDGLFISKKKSGEDNYYQLIFFPSKVLEQPDTKKSLILVDFDKNKTTLKINQLFDEIRKNLLETFTAKDSFNIILSNFQMKPLSPVWLPGDKAVINELFDYIFETSISDYSNLAYLIMSGIDWVKNKGGKQILLFANTDQQGSRDAANKLIEGIMKEIPKDIPMYCCDYGNKSLMEYTISNIKFVGNEYLFSNLSKITLGNYYSIRKTTNLNQLVSNVCNGLSGTITAFDFYTTLSSGFCYGRYTSTASKELISYNSMISETGKFYGDLPFKISLSGFFKGKPFSETININEDDFSKYEYDTKTIWNGKYIQSLEAIPNRSNDLTWEIIKQSMSNRILSLYTAFLALEPGMTIDTSDSENGDLTSVIDESSGTRIICSPNPFAKSTTISFNPKELELTGDVEIRIFDVLGNIIRNIHLDETALQTGKFVWDGTDVSGRELPSGAYVILLKSRTKVYALRVLIMR